MILPIESETPPLEACDDGVVRVAGTRIPLERIVRAFLAGATPEQLVQDYDVLTIEDVYGVITYYLRHRSEVDLYLAAARQNAEQTRHEVELANDPTGVRQRLLARQSNRRADT